MWDFFETVRHRHSIRRFQTDRPVEAEKLHAILEMATTAPSAGDVQPYHIEVVRGAGPRRALAAAAPGEEFIAEAPVSLVFAAEPGRSEARFGERGANLYAIQDTTIAAAYAQLAVVAAGMGSTWVGHFDEEAVRGALALKAGLQPLTILCVGYPAEFPEPSPRRALDEIVGYHD
ncbi:MAG: nitroreductase family protein [Pseudomonadota bacterium]